MNLRSVARTGRKAFRDWLEMMFRSIERSEMSRGGVLSMIPSYSVRQGKGAGLGTVTYGEWCYTVGVFQSILFQNLPQSRPVRMLDVGCGTGRLYLAAKSFLIDGGHYTGIDIGASLIEICNEQYKDFDADFVFYDAPNAVYSDSKRDTPGTWPLGENRYNLITALSVWTHLREEDWIAYLSQVADRLEADGVAIISFFVLDEIYNATLPDRSDAISQYYPQSKSKWIFDQPAYDSTEWFYPGWASHPETAIGLTAEAFHREVEKAGLKVKTFYPGSWKERPGLFFQDIAVLQLA